MLRGTVLMLAMASCGATYAQTPAEGSFCTPVMGNWSPLDAERKLQVEIRLRDAGQPWREVPTPPGRTELYCLVQQMPANVRITEIRTFVATDRGQKAEIDLKVMYNATQLVTRSEHKETDGVYDAWKTTPVNYVTAPHVSKAQLWILASGWSTEWGATANMEVGVIVSMQMLPPPSVEKR